MRIHTNKVDEVHRLIRAATYKMSGVYAEVSEYGSRSRKGAIELKLTGNSGRYRNTGKWGADSYENAATWDEWGVVLAAVFEADPDAICGSAKRPVYSGHNDYHWQTGERFAHVGATLGTTDPLVPEDTHANHRWDYVAQGTRECRKCSATSHAPLRG